MAGADPIRCSICKQLKPIDAYYWDNRTQRPRSQCKRCVNDNGKRRREGLPPVLARTAVVVADGHAHCRRCGLTKPLAGFYPDLRRGGVVRQPCRECQLEASRTWKDANRARVNEVNRAWQNANRQRFRQIVNESTRRWRINYPDRAERKEKAYRAKNPGRVRAQNREWYRRNRAWARAKWHRRRAAKLLLPHRWTPADEARALAYWGDKCPVCGVALGLLANREWDHWIPLTSPECPGTIPSNMIPLCESCNSGKKDQEPEVWLIKKTNPADARRIMRAIRAYQSAVNAEPA